MDLTGEHMINDTLSTALNGAADNFYIFSAYRFLVSTKFEDFSTFLLKKKT